MELDLEILKIFSEVQNITTVLELSVVALGNFGDYCGHLELSCFGDYSIDPLRWGL